MKIVQTLKGERMSKKIYLIWEKHNGVERRLKTAYFSKTDAYRKMNEWNNRTNEHTYYIKELEVH